MYLFGYVRYIRPHIDYEETVLVGAGAVFYLKWLFTAVDDILHMVRIRLGPQTDVSLFWIALRIDNHLCDTFHQYQ